MSLALWHPPLIGPLGAVRPEDCLIFRAPDEAAFVSTTDARHQCQVVAEVGSGSIGKIPWNGPSCQTVHRTEETVFEIGHGRAHECGTGTMVVGGKADQ